MRLGATLRSSPMSDSSEYSIKIELPQLKQEFTFETPQQLFDWQQQRREEWLWLNNSPAKNAWLQQENHLTSIKQAANEWMGNPHHQGLRDRTKITIQGAIQQMFSQDNSLFGNQAHITFIKEVLEKHGAAAASGVYAVLSRSDIHFERNVNESFFGGLLRGFLFQNEIDWTASVHRNLLEELEAQYKQRLEDQDVRLKTLEAENLRLNEAHDKTLKSKSDELNDLKASKTSTLDALHAAKDVELNNLYAVKDKAFAELAAKHEANLKAIEDTFHNKLALQKPVDYWLKRHQSHVKMATVYSVLAGLSFAGAGYGLFRVVYWAFGHLDAKASPDHWRVGVVLISAFFAIWIIRVLVRLFLSHQHLATDAAQRVTMVQTFLSLSKEHEGFAKEDRSVVLQQLFKSVSDGIVKDDAAPPGLMEWLSRQR